MNSNWKKYKIGSIASQIAIGPFGSRMKSDCYVSEGVPVIRGMNIGDLPGFISDFVYITPEKADDLRGSNVFKDDLVFPHRGAIGEVGIMVEESRFVLSSSLMKLTANYSLANPLFLYYFFKSPDGKRKLLKNESQVGTPGIAQPLSSLKEIEILLPPLNEQKAIASILSALDDKIELNLQMNKTLGDMAMTLYKHWFVDFGPFKDGEFVSSELGEIPKGWEVKRLPEVSINHNKKRAPISTRERSKIEGEYPYYGATKILDYINDYRFDGEFILLAEDGTVKTERGTPFLQFIEGKFWVSNHAHVLSGRNNYSNEFLYLCLSNTNVIPIITGAVQLKINKENLETLKFICPDILSLGRFQEMTIPLFKQIKSNEKENQVLITLRDTLLPKLISGEVRVKETTKTFEEVL